MSAKLSTEKLKELIGTWLATDAARHDLKHHSDLDNPDEMTVDWANGDVEVTRLQYVCRLYGAPLDSTLVQLEEFIWHMWCDGSQWKRCEKRQLKDEAEDTFTQVEYIGEWKKGLPGNQQARRTVESFPCDLMGEHNPELVTKFFNDLKAAQKCIYRTFVPNNQLADNYRLEVITTPDDTEVVGWWVTVD